MAEAITSPRLPGDRETRFLEETLRSRNPVSSRNRVSAVAGDQEARFLRETGFLQSRNPVSSRNRVSADCHFPLAHHLHMPLHELAMSPLPPPGRTKGIRPWNLIEGRLRHVFTHDIEWNGQPIARPFAPQGIQEPASAARDDLPRPRGGDLPPE